MKIKINNKAVNVPKVSELTAMQFIAIFDVKEDVTIPKYLSYFLKISEDQVNKLYISADAAFALFNVNVAEMINTKKTVYLYEGKYYETKENHFNFGQAYLLEKYRRKGTTLTHALRALAIATADSLDMGEVDKTFEVMRQYRWIDVMPQAVFFCNRISGSSSNLRKELRISIRVLRKNSARTRIWMESQKTMQLRSLRRPLQKL